MGIHTIAVGTGFIVTPSGHILTANHVLKPENEATVVNSEDIFVSDRGSEGTCLARQGAGA